jgi:hypothetical protein
MSNPLIEAIKNEAQLRAGTDATPARKPATAANEIDPARVAALAASLVGSAKAEATHYRMDCPSCGAVHEFSSEDLPAWETSEEAGEVDGKDPEQDGDGVTDPTDPDELEDRKAKAIARAKHRVKAVQDAVQRVRNEATSKEINPLIEAMKNVRSRK